MNNHKYKNTIFVKKNYEMSTLFYLSIIIIDK